jgi:Uma2 family endonuclease
VKKDRERLPRLYAQAGIPELWLTDAREENLRFEIHALRDGRYEPVTPDGEGWVVSARLGHAFRLNRRRRPDLGTWRYMLENREA